MSLSKSINIAGRQIVVKETAIDRLIGWINPQKALARLGSRALLEMHARYVGASKDRRATRSWLPGGADADGEILPDLETLRARSRDLLRNAPLAAGAVNTVVANVVGSGLKLQARPDREYLGLADQDADRWESSVEREWRLWSESANLDAARTLDFAAFQELAFRQTLENGDVFILLPKIARLGSPYSLCLQMVEGDRVCNPNFGIDKNQLAGGVEKDKHGAPVAYHILNQHPGSRKFIEYRWKRVPAFGSKTSLRSVLHLYRMLRPDQSRGVPYLAPVIEPLKQLDRYTEAEIMAAVVSGMFTVFVKSEIGGGLAGMGAAQSVQGVPVSASEDEYRLGNGAIIDLATGEDVTIANPGRPNTAFDPFIQAVLRQIGVALELPFEVLIKHYTASYSAARAAMLDAWKFFLGRRAWLARSFCQPVYETWLTEAVALGRIAAPGFFTDPLIRKAWLGSEWVGPSRGQIDELKEIKAARERIAAGVSTISEVTAEMTGGDWERKHAQRVKEATLRQAAGLENLLDYEGQKEPETRIEE